MAVESWRVAQIVTDRGADGGSCRGSGYLVAPGAVLTAAHVVAGALTVRVRLDVGQPTEMDVLAERWWADPDVHRGTDLAVVIIPGNTTANRKVELAQFGRVGDTTAVLAVQALGFPRFKLRESAAGGEPEVFRDLDQVTGHAPVAANRRQGTLAVYLDDPAPAVQEPAGPSPWEGMSGAAVWASDRIIAIVAEHHSGEGTGRLTARRIDKAYERLQEADLHRLVTWLGLAPARNGLPDAVPAGAWQLLQSAYLEQVRDIAPDTLVGRDDELAQLAEFCAGSEVYTWLQAEPWSGKSALASWFVTHPPAGVDVVSFFITGRLYGQADSDAFMDAMIEQLGALDPVNGQLPPAVGARAGTWLSRLAHASSRANELGRRLVVVVDGLDEDEAGASPPRGRSSIAALLPRRPPPGARFIVTSRPGPGLPEDVPSGHPLHICVPRRLSMSWAAEGMERRAKRELQDLLMGDEIAVDVVGYIAGSGGGLTRSDLAVLTGAPPHKLDTALRGVSGRSLQTRMSAQPADGNSDPATRVYLFAHETLRVTAEQQLGTEVARYRERVHDWVRGYADRKWPDTTPTYAVRSYSRLLTATSDDLRLTVLARDPNRHSFLLRATGDDYAVIAEIREAQRVITAQAAPDLQALVELAVYRHAVSIRNQPIPADLPGVWARLAHFDHAEAMARVITDPHAQAQALVELVAITARAGKLDRAEAVARVIVSPEARVRALSQLAAAAAQALDLDRAHRLAVDSEALARSTASSSALARALTAVAAVAARSGNLDRAEAVTRSIAHPGERTEALTGLVTGIAEAGDLACAEAVARSITDSRAQAGALTDLAAAAIRMADLGRASRLAADAEAVARSITDSRAQAGALTDLAAAIRAADLGRASRLDADAEAVVGGITDLRTRAQALTALATASIPTGNLDHASRLAAGAEAAARSISDPRAKVKALSGLVIAIAQIGRPDHASRLAADVEVIARAITEPRARARALAEVAGANAESGNLGRAETVARTITGPHGQALALAAAAAGAAHAGDMDSAESFAGLVFNLTTRAQVLTALAAAAVLAGDTDRASQLAAKAETTARLSIDSRAQAQALATLAAAAARAGDPDRASQLAASAQACATDLTDPHAQPVALAPVVAAIAQAGDLDRAEALACSITSRRDKARALTELVPAIAQAAQLDRAEIVARTITDPRGKAQALNALAVAAIRAGDSDRADAAARAIPDPRDKVRTFAAIAAAAAQAGDLDRAEALARSIAGRRNKERAQTDLIPEIIKAGDLNRAQVVARTITDPRARLRALAAVAVAATQAGQPRRASQLAGEAEAAVGDVTDPRAQAQVLAVLAAGTIWAGDLDRASQLAANAEAIASAITEPDARARALTGVAVETAQAPYLLDRAEAVARSISDPDASAQALAQMAAAVIRAGDLYRATRLAADADALAQTIPDPYAQAEALTQLAALAAQSGEAGRAQHLLALAVTSDLREIGPWAGAISRLFPQVIKDAGEVFLSAYQAEPQLLDRQSITVEISAQVKGQVSRPRAWGVPDIRAIVKRTIPRAGATIAAEGLWECGVYAVRRRSTPTGLFQTETCRESR